ncbi:hypothetical protein K505DRAFT_362839 [Melanomma pulvis-pyrius CBS 109.77]|uniref:F-box domain-containing protein n=1 Tax=Melanomma pulvis-pyrius CBS 109.77 TaxID=1314802 RepID=A0A6A6X9S7_9PLEO|nr:hypothetical protein K505DRAFT_362839 [Melanomma pulvis-pyrius CBS 109.77]
MKSSQNRDQASRSNPAIGTKRRLHDVGFDDHVSRRDGVGGRTLAKRVRNTAGVAGHEDLQLLHNSHNPLLSLPGEIRNLVYAYAVEKEVPENEYYTAPHIITLNPPPPPHHDEPPSTPLLPIRQWWRLTQVCKQMRYEFYPLYMRRTEVRIRFRDSLQYLRTFFPTEGKDTNRIAAYNGNFKIMVEEMRGEKKLDILPLIKLCVRAPRVKCCFESTIAPLPPDISDSADGRNQINGLNRLLSNELARPSILTGLSMFTRPPITKIYYSLPKHAWTSRWPTQSRFLPKVRIMFRGEWRQEWMNGKIWLKFDAKPDAKRTKWHLEHDGFDNFIRAAELWWTYEIWEIMTYCKEEEDTRMTDAVELEYSDTNKT